MSANRFATMVHRSTNILIYAFLEWTLILLLLLNSLFSYLIPRFAAYFGLDLPCPWCTTIDHHFHPRDLLCELHAKEVSGLGFCLTHHRLVESQDLCPSCLPRNDGESSSTFHNDHCTCCGVGLEREQDAADQHLEFCLDSGGTALLPVDSEAVECGKGKAEIRVDFDINVIPDCSSETEDDECCLVFHPKSDEIASFTPFRWASGTAASENHLHDDPGFDQGSNGNDDADVSIGTEIPDLDIPDDCIDCNKSEDDNCKFPDTPASMKSALRAARQALQVAYAELEEERSASAVAASQTMAMINRLQEEKAAMQMEALQYQRMMEEQSEYDQEALQLLNHLMLKRERELEEYRRKLHDSESTRLSRRSRDGSVRSGLSSASCSDDSDGVDDREEDSNPVVGLEESLAGFEEERLSILDQLRVLEDRLPTLDAEKDHPFEVVVAMQDCNGDRQLAIDEEVDRLYERLHALESDCEFLKHCITSLKKGDKGTDLLREILQHLRDLRSAELKSGTII